ncbi:MAG: elongation factor P [Phycisphaerales bacterium]|nr:elongation factor P [Phycisphaerales bacterium]
MKATMLRPGLACKMDGKLYVITKFEHRTPGNLRAFIQIKIKDVMTGNQLEKRLGSADEVDVVNLDRREMEYLFSDNTGHTFMDSENYEQVTLDDDFMGDGKLYLRPNTKVFMLVHDEKPVLIELPATVELTVTDTPPGIKGATVTNQLKEATMETGLKTRVPSFIEIGETLKISTEDGSYMSRA